MKLRTFLLPAFLCCASPALQANDYDSPAFVDSSAGSCAMRNDAGVMVHTTDTSMVVANDPLSGAVHLRCSFDTTPTISGKTWNERGFLCIMANPLVGVLIGFDSHIRQTPKGRMTLTCHFNN
ncbi:MAG: hypothetical protein HKO64_07560 [Xanthomonadales bacterium]|nr:hypothetical protein [Gammaproteobacteria bacterium]NNE05686.1 hypothetical protein [Xanthomonadales bacterium]NNL95466.1 hypothetical protein [Xanthomonadales bacterium]